MNQVAISPGRGSTSLHGRFRHQALIRPNNIAVCYEDERLTYKQLDSLATTQSEYLVKQGVLPGDMIAVMLPRGIDLIVHILAVLKAGASYVPIDPNYPTNRVDWVLKTSNPICLISNRAQHKQMWEGQEPDSLKKVWVHLVDDDKTEDAYFLGMQESTQSRSKSRSVDTAYVIFTSGSTGKPKGVMVGHDQVIAMLDAVTPLLRNDHRDVWSLFHSFAFDFSVWEIWGALTSGAGLCIVPQETSWSADSFSQFLRTERVTILSQTPSAFYALMTSEQQALDRGEKPLSLRAVVFGGEALNLKKLDEWWKNYPEGKPRLINMYGITETTVHVTWLELSRDLIYEERSPIGKAIPGLEVQLLDKQLKLVAEGEVGEMYISGKQLAFGYLGRPDLTASRFIASPFNSGERLYRTGDLALRRNGQLFYFGRSDRQLKVRGFRIEPEEIESAIESHPGVQQSVVLPKPKVNSFSYEGLIAFQTTKKNVALPLIESTLRAYLANKLPAHLIPSDFLFVASFPLTVNGKLDQDALLHEWKLHKESQNLPQKRMELLREKMAKTTEQLGLSKQEPLNLTEISE